MHECADAASGCIDDAILDRNHSTHEPRLTSEPANFR